MSKYIIKNCPCIIEFKNMHFCAELNNVDELKQLCQDCTDCVLKQIVEKCKEIKCPCEYKGADCWECTESGAKRFADRILQLLDIQEVE